MKEQFAKNICRYRKEKGLTQEGLANQLGLTYQAVSKWETAQTMPDIMILPKLSRILEVSVDKLLGYVYEDKPVTIYEDAYKTEDYYWGIEPSAMCYQVLQLMPPIRHLKVLDIGCGEGKDSVFFARNGYDVTAVDISDAGLDKTKRLSEQTGVYVKTIKADILDYRLNTNYDILFSSGVLHYIKPNNREEIFNNYKQHTNPDGIHVFNVFVQKPFIAPPPEKEPNSYPWISGEIFSLYRDWLIRDCSEFIFDCNSSGTPHQHAMNKVVAQKVSG